MCDTEGNKHICIIDNMFNCQQPHQLIHLKEKNHSTGLDQRLGIRILRF